MHVIIAGAARCGKTTLSLMLNDLGYTHYKMDSIKRGICDAYDLNYEKWAEVSPIMCKIINRIIEDNKTDINYSKEKYLFDTPFLYPEDTKLINLEDTLLIFIGCAEISVYDEMKRIRMYDGDNIWTNSADDELLRSYIEKNINYSKKIKEDCEILNIKYFDVSKDYNETLNEIKQYIIENDNLR